MIKFKPFILQTLAFILLVFNLFNVQAQDSGRQKDLLKSLKSEKNDSTRIYLMAEIAYEFEGVSLDSAMIWYDKAINLAKKTKNKYWICKNYGYKGIVYQYMHLYDSSVVFNERAIWIAKELKDTLQQAKLYCNLGKTYFEGDKIVSAVHTYKKGLILAKKLKHQQLISTCYRGIGVSYDKMGNHQYALKYHNMAMEIDKKNNLERDLAMDYANIAAIYDDLEKYDIANDYYEKTIVIFSELGIIGEELAITYNNQASIQTKMGDPKKALSLFMKAKEQFFLSKDEGNIPFINKNIAMSYLALNKIDLAKMYIDSSLLVYSMKSNPNNTLDSKHILAEILIKQNRHQEAAALLLVIYDQRDSLQASYQARQIGELEIKFQTKEKDIKLKQAEAERKKKDTELSLQKSINERRQTLVFGLFGIGVLLLFLFLNVRRSHNKTKLANKLIAQQKEEVVLQKMLIEEKNEEITSSIRYALSIQTAILPPPQLINELFSENFIFYKPKDIIAGDFYWFEAVEDLIFFAAADCTGHGVPGAMVSVVCHNALNQSIREHKIYDSAEILNKTRELVINTFEKSESNIKDGMDISLCVINKNTRELQFSGANNSLWILRNGEDEIIKLKADRQAIGFSHENYPFKSHHFQLQEKDRIYAFTDGFVDQFGGDSEKKYKAKRFEEFVLSIQEFPVKEQSNLLLAEFESWKGNTEQTDDVCIVCVEI